MGAVDDYMKYAQYVEQVKAWHKRLIAEVAAIDKDMADRKLVRKAEEIANGYMTK